MSIYTLRQPVSHTVTLTAATEGSWVMPEGVSAFEVRSRNQAQLRMSFQQGEVNGGSSYYITIETGNGWKTPDGQSIAFPNGTTVYFYSAAGDTAEIIYWIK